MKGKVIIISAPSGAGKTSIVRHLLTTQLPLAFSVSATSRPKRDYEIDGKDYYFIPISEFKQRIKNGDFLEWEEVYKDQFYGSLKCEIERIWSIGKHVLFDVDVVGALNIKKTYGDDALSIFIKPPHKETLKERLHCRGTEDEQSLEKRIAKAEYELSFENQFDCIIVNDSLATAQEEAAEKILQFINQS
jgi:guanylate kinase